MSVPKDPIVLLAEDSADDAYFFKRTLQKSALPFSLEQVMNGAEAIEFLRQAAAAGSLPSILFLDLKMPLLNGFEVLTWVKQQPFAGELPVVVLSGSGQEQDVERAADLGAIDYVIKPITVGHLRRHLSGLISNAFKTHPAENGAGL